MLRSVWALLVTVVATMVLGSGAMLACIVYPPSFATMRLGRVWSRIILASAGVRVEPAGLGHARTHLPCLYVANHQSMIDICAMALFLPDATIFVAKRSLFRVPFLGWAMSAAGFVPVDRARRSRAIESLAAAADRVRSGRPLVLFAEGTRSRDGRLGPFKKGPFHVALQAGVPVVPLSVSGSRAILPPGHVLPLSGSIRVGFGRPLQVDRFLPDDVEGLLAEVRGRIAEGLEPEEGPVEGEPVVAGRS